jgi:hypothetical protein
MKGRRCEVGDVISLSHFLFVFSFSYLTRSLSSVKVVSLCLYLYALSRCLFILSLLVCRLALPCIVYDLFA